MTIKEEISERLKFVTMEIDVCNNVLNIDEETGMVPPHRPGAPEDYDFLCGKRITLLSEQLFLVTLVNKIESLGNERSI